MTIIKILFTVSDIIFFFLVNFTIDNWIFMLNEDQLELLMHRYLLIHMVTFIRSRWSWRRAATFLLDGPRNFKFNKLFIQIWCGKFLPYNDIGVSERPKRIFIHLNFFEHFLYQIGILNLLKLIIFYFFFMIFLSHLELLDFSFQLKDLLLKLTIWVLYICN